MRAPYKLGDSSKGKVAGQGLLTKLGSFSTDKAVLVQLGRGESFILTLVMIFRVKINVNIYIEPRNEVKIFKKLILGISIFTQKLTRPPLWAKKYSQI